MPLFPAELAHRFAGGLDAFVDEFPDPFLLVTVAANRELEAWLGSISTLGGVRLQPSETVTFSTELGSAPFSWKKLRLPDLTVASLRARLANERIFAALLQKRPDASAKPFAERISVGRARNNDIVLRDRTVSKFHAWFEMDETNALYVADADSTNGTMLNVKKLVPRELVRVNSADQVLFGSIECVACDPADFWRALRSSGNKRPRSA